ncbi:phenylalanine--tRNA ligase subunit alpha [Candidatus Roizmanbacteria bacterium RIFCSPHIGHO2_01_FULL_39_12c]|uniref:Phenylalanine--tRNA ligase alpha subunit n=1 Tax=Candidatus Roizmanbacteria bacterium RIFCSPHIGHO2_01_FULL_39_12c TaxID=1802031 RepID=A0A1F7G800_9BACT|nr:MAG: phenylalanine--tRNA ligase subunit alpha [Candidatus Roizmanbacteria bacterium RIFCSPHIGHO2_01_FULL_39_12c]OGK46272.1 MAG: phenylalanine--tRNA ligase subunit alpha [Candidatus Roizmanbacteria bacterium RIFCSPLOWO2_01_FULL_40_13]
MEQLNKYKIEFSRELNSIKSQSDLDSLQIKYLGRKGIVNSLLQSIDKLRQEERKEFGKKVNDLKTSINQLIDAIRQELLKNAGPGEFIDVSLPGKKYPRGSLHLATYAIEEISKIFQKIGFIRMSYPEVEWEHYAFDSLNMPKEHPARDDFETFFIDAPEHEKYGKMVLTPHTSSGQLREMQRVKKPPVRMINIAKCYRPNWDTSHTPMFHQFEGMVVDKEINITHLKGTIDYFAKEFFGAKREIRLRPFHFQFTEPSFEVDITCGICSGTGVTRNLQGSVKCRLCKSGWLELGGSGMIHPNVLKAVNIDPEKFSGWAFGIGVERVIMMKEDLKLDDLRIMYENDIRFLEQF